MAELQKFNDLFFGEMIDFLLAEYNVEFRGLTFQVFKRALLFTSKISLFGSSNLAGVGVYAEGVAIALGRQKVEEVPGPAAHGENAGIAISRKVL